MQSIGQAKKKQQQQKPQHLQRAARALQKDLPAKFFLSFLLLPPLCCPQTPRADNWLSVTVPSCCLMFSWMIPEPQSTHEWVRTWAPLFPSINPGFEELLFNSLRASNGRSGDSHLYTILQQFFILVNDSPCVNKSTSVEQLCVLKS